MKTSELEPAHRRDRRRRSRAGRPPIPRCIATSQPHRPGHARSCAPRSSSFSPSAALIGAADPRAARARRASTAPPAWRWLAAAAHLGAGRHRRRPRRFRCCSTPARCWPRCCWPAGDWSIARAGARRRVRPGRRRAAVQRRAGAWRRSPSWRPVPDGRPDRRHRC